MKESSSGHITLDSGQTLDTVLFKRCFIENTVIYLLALKFKKLESMKYFKVKTIKKKTTD